MCSPAVIPTVGSGCVRPPRPHTRLCLQVEPFLLVPRLSGENERDRRKELLRRRNEHIQLTGGPVGACMCTARRSVAK